MQDLRDKLLKAGAVSKKQARKAGIEARREQRQAEGGKGSQQQREQRQQEREQQRRERHEDRRAQEREEARRRQAELNREAEQRAQRARIEDLIRAHSVPQRPVREQAERPFYFVGPDRRVRRIHVSHELAGRLSRGEVAIVTVSAGRAGGRDFALVDLQGARRLEELDPGRILFWCQDEGGELPTHGGG